MLTGFAPERTGAAAATASNENFRVRYVPNQSTVAPGTAVTYRYEFTNLTSDTYIFSRYGSWYARLSDSGCTGAGSVAPSTSTGWKSDGSNYWIAPGGTAYVECTATVNSTTTSTASITEFGYANSPTATTWSVETTAVSASETVTVASDADYRLAVTPTPSTVTPGGDVIWTVKVNNVGLTTSNTIDLVHTLPAGFTAISSDDGCAVSGQSVTCSNQPAVASNASRTYTIRTRAPTTTGTTTTPTVISVDGGASGSSRTASTNVTVTTPPAGGTSTDGDFTVTKTPSAGNVPSGGADVTYTYSVKNNRSSRQYYYSGTDDKCSPLTYQSGMVRVYDFWAGHEFSYIPGGGTATFTCRTYVSATTTNTVTMVFADSYSYSWIAGSVSYSGASTAATSATVTRAQPTDVGGQTCDAVWYSSDERTATTSGNGTVGTLSPTTGAAAPVFDIGAQTGDSRNGSAAVAMNPGNPRLVYFIPRRGTTSADLGLGLWVYDRSTDKSRLVTNTVPDSGNALTRLGFDPYGNIWTIGIAGHVYSLRPSDSSPTWQDRGTMQVPASVGTPSHLQSGDLAFDGLGTMYFITSDINAGTRMSYLLTINYGELTDGSPSAKLAGRMGGSLGFNGLALAGSGLAYGSEGTRLHKVALDTGTPTLIGDAAPQLLGDLTSCALPRPLLRVTKSVTPYGPVTTGTTLRYTIRVENIGTLAATNVTLRDIPDGAGLASASLNGGSNLGASYYSTARPVNSPGDLPGVVAPGETATITATAKAVAGVTQVCNQSQTTYEGSADVVLSDDANRPGAADKTCTPVYSPQITIAKKASTDTLDSTGADTPVTYTYEVTNSGNEKLSGVAVTDDRCSAPVYRSGDSDGDDVLTAPETWVYQCTQTLAGTNRSGSSVRNRATVTAVSGVTNTSVTHSTSFLVTPPGLTFRKTSSTGGRPVSPGDVVTYTLTGRNTTANRDALTDVVMRDSLPAGMTYVPGSATVTLPSGSSRATAVPDLITAADHVSLTHGQTVTVTFQAKVDVTAGSGPTTLTNVATGASHETEATTDEATERVARPLVDVVKAPGRITGPNSSGQYAATYTVHVSNTGPGSAVVGALTDTPRYAPGLRPLTASWSGDASGSQSLSGPDYAFTLGPANTTLDAGQDATYDVVITFERTGSGAVAACGGAGTATYNEVALPAGQQTGPNTNDSACIDPEPRFALRKNADGGPPGGVGTVARARVDAATGDVLLTSAYTVRIANSGLVAAVPPDVIDRVFLPTGFEITGVTVDGASQTVSGSTVTISGGSTAVPVGGYRDVVVAVTARATAADTTDWALSGACVVDNGEIVPPGGVINSVTTADEASSPTERPNDTDGRANNAGCTPFTPPLASMSVVKLGRNCDVSQPTCHLPGSSFSLYGADPTAGAAPVPNGFVVDAGDASRFVSTPLQMFTPYWVVETRAPAGHTLLPSSVPLTLGTNGIRLSNAADPDVVRVGGTDATTLEVVDDTPVALPRTGGLGIWPALLAGTGLVGVGAVALIRAGSRPITRRGP